MSTCSGSTPQLLSPVPLSLPSMGKHDAKQLKLTFESKRHTRYAEGGQNSEVLIDKPDDEGPQDTDLREVLLESKDIHLLADIHTKLSDFQEEALQEIRYLHRDAQACRDREGDRPGKTLTGLFRYLHPFTYVAELLDSELNPVSCTPDLLPVTRSCTMQPQPC
ncbi:hypothetical protein NDU88_000418 [Pleurodeles waltl]|uniref:Uncharacterized protein n=1 Tax=Pleurodeles waltl TaxID=8319 RepID=A0AAV7UTZ8_PLEWA|nr:hypothetical protein NDU88_000418 [Pleurodeles waltl]